MRVTLRDRITGEVATCDNPSISPYDWTFGNWSCDCNRIHYFDVEEPEGVGICLGEVRFVVIAVDPMPGGYTLADFNSGYPPA